MVDSNLLVTKEACKIHNDQMKKEIDNLESAIISLQRENSNQSIAIEGQSKVLEHLTKSIDTLNSLMGAIKDELSTVDKEQAIANAVNTQANNFNLELNWKTIGVIGLIAMSIVNTVLGKF